MLRVILLVSFYIVGVRGSLLSAMPVADCFDAFSVKMGLDESLQSDPEMFMDVFEKEFYLGESEEARVLFTSYFHRSESFAELLKKIKHGVVNRQPAVGEFLCSALSKNLIPDADARTKLLAKRTLHNILILDTLVAKMADDPEFILILKDYYRKVRHRLLPEDSSFFTVYRATGGMFEMSKFLTMDQVLDQYYYFLTKKDALNAGDLADKNFGLRLNILEATLTDQFRLNLDNAAAGVALMKNPMEGLGREAGVLKQYFRGGWASLYETWNLAFVLGNLENMNIILPKLLIPHVIDAKEEDYLMFRGLSLWITIHLYLLHHLNGKPDVFIPPEVRNPLVKEWGRINRKYADSLKMKPGQFVLPYILSVLVNGASRVLS